MERMAKFTVKVVGLVVFVGLLVPSRVMVGRGYAGEKVEVTFSNSFVSKYIWRGYDILNDDPAYQPSLDFSFGDSGFSANIWGSFALKSGAEDLDELDYSLTYGRALSDGLDGALGYVYYDYPNVSSSGDINEFWASLSFTGVFLAPTLSSYYDFPQEGGGPENGWYHSLSLGYDLAVPGFEEQVISLGAGLWYNDGASGAESGISHGTFDVSTEFTWRLFTITPSLHYQITAGNVDDTINEEDEFWGGLDFSLSF